MTGNTHTASVSCPNCSGFGEVVTDTYAVAGREENHREYGPCGRCGGTGRIDGPAWK